MILVINYNKSAYIQKYKLFYHASEAIEWANSLGFSKHSFIGLSESDLVPGMSHRVDAGSECNVEIIRIDPESKTHTTTYDNIGWGGC